MRVYANVVHGYGTESRVGNASRNSAIKRRIRGVNQVVDKYRRSCWSTKSGGVISRAISLNKFRIA